VHHHFTKTGSGQTQQKLRKRGRFFAPGFHTNRLPWGFNADHQVRGDNGSVFATFVLIDFVDDDHFTKTGSGQM
jgi:hypothetical protein